MKPWNQTLGGVLLLALLAWAHPAAAQSDAERQAQASLRSRIEQRFNVAPVQNGIVLTPRRAIGDVRSIELTNGAIAVDGQPVSGAELRRRLGTDADPIIRLSYLDAAAQQALFGLPVSSPAPAEPQAGPPLPPSPPPPPLEPERPRRGRGGRDRGDLVRVGRPLRVETGEIVEGDAVAVGGHAYIDGIVRGDVVAIGGGAELGPHADVNDVVVIGGRLERDPAAQVRGNEVDLGLLDLPISRWSMRPTVSGLLGFGAVRSLASLAATIARFVLLCILGSIVLLVAGTQVERIGTRAAAEPVKAGLVGLLIQVLFFPLLLLTTVVLVVTIVGIPLLLVLVPFAVLALAVVFLVGFTAVAHDIGQLAGSRFGWQGLNPYVVAAVGIALLLSPILLARLAGFGGAFLVPIAWALVILGFFVEYSAWTVGLGAVALLGLDRRRGNVTTTPVAPPTPA